MYRVADILRASGQRTTAARRASAIQAATRGRRALASTAGTASSAPGSSAASAAAAAASTPPIPFAALTPSRPRRRASDMGSPAAIAAGEEARAKKRAKSAERTQAALAKSAAAAGDGSSAQANLPLWLWRKQPRTERWAHLRDGVFPLAEASSGNDAGAPLSLMHGASANLFTERATIHRIIGFESDLILEARRDNTKSAEVALVGRSNVGKSSLLNALLKNGGLRKQLATVSKTPGRTQQLFMFSFENERNCRIVDW